MSTEIVPSYPGQPLMLVGGTQFPKHPLTAVAESDPQAGCIFFTRAWIPIRGSLKYLFVAAIAILLVIIVVKLLVWILEMILSFVLLVSLFYVFMKGIASLINCKPSNDESSNRALVPSNSETTLKGVSAMSTEIVPSYPGQPLMLVGGTQFPKHPLTALAEKDPSAAHDVLLAKSMEGPICRVIDKLPHGCKNVKVDIGPQGWFSCSGFEVKAK